MRSATPYASDGITFSGSFWPHSALDVMLVCVFLVGQAGIFLHATLSHVARKWYTRFPGRLFGVYTGSVFSRNDATGGRCGGHPSGLLPTRGARFCQKKKKKEKKRKNVFRSTLKQIPLLSGWKTGCIACLVLEWTQVDLTSSKRSSSSVGDPSQPIISATRRASCVATVVTGESVGSYA